MGFFSKKEIKQEVQPVVTDTEQGKLATTEGSAPAQRKCMQMLTRIFAEGQDATVMKIYIENFKRLNELFGYDYCEDLLNQILEFLEKELQVPIYHYIGVEFVAILHNRTIGEISRKAEKLEERFERGWKIRDTDCVCSIQMGLCSCPGYPENVTELLKYLDTAVYKAAELGANQCVVYDSKLHNQYVRRQTITRYLNTALENNEIEVRYHPTYNIKENKFTRAEFYMRIFVKGVGMVGAGEFLPIAEDSGQIRSVEYYALDKVAAMIARLLDMGKEFDSISLPVSPVLLLQEDFVEEVERVLKQYEIPAEKLALEIDEYAMSMAYIKTQDVMAQFADLGVELVLAHFGSGYSGLSQIFELPIQTVKFDRMFTWQLETSPNAEPIIEGLCQIVHKVGRKLIAEGVETQKQLDALGRFECEMQQGFYYSPTLTEDVLVQVISTDMKESREIIEEAREEMKS